MATCSSRVATVAAMASSSEAPVSRSCTTSQAAAARSWVSRSTAQAPPAGSVTAPTCASSVSSAIWLRAMRRPKASGRPRGRSKGCTVTASAPPTVAAKAATVVRSMLTQGSYALIIGRLVTACCRWSTGPAPQICRSRDQSSRAARSLAMVGNWSSVAA